MGRRKSKRKPEARKKNIEALDTQFTCPFCNHEKSCEVSAHIFTNTILKSTLYLQIRQVKMDKSKHAAKIQCTVCLEDFQATINFLSEPVLGPDSLHCAAQLYPSGGRLQRVDRRL
jgi:transcription elongation factor Elf1